MGRPPNAGLGQLVVCWPSSDPRYRFGENLLMSGPVATPSDLAERLRDLRRRLEDARGYL